jgi:hypothetical protein
MTAREYAEYCYVDACPETTKRGPTPQQAAEFEAAKKMWIQRRGS